jgi:hypothetical protein
MSSMMGLKTSTHMTIRMVTIKELLTIMQICSIQVIKTTKNSVGRESPSIVIILKSTSLLATRLLPSRPLSLSRALVKLRTRVNSRREAQIRQPLVAKRIVNQITNYQLNRLLMPK